MMPQARTGTTAAARREGRKLMVEIEVTRPEKDAGALTPEHRQAAVRAVRDDGFVVLKGVVDTAHLDVLHARMLEDLARLRARKDAPFNWNAGNVQQNPPPFPPYLFRDVLVNDFAVEVAKAILGPGMKNSFYSGNTAVRAEGDPRQPVHADTGQLWPDQEAPHPPAQLVVNVPVVDMSAENGSTEIWPGTHRDLSVTWGKDIKVPAEKLEARRAVAPPLQPTVSRGSVLIRDIRLWHAGMPNRTDAPRPMIALIYHCGWLEMHSGLRFPKGTESLFTHPDLTTVARFVDESEGPIDHISAPQAYEYAKN
jgi:hypothetical protein